MALSPGTRMMSGEELNAEKAATPITTVVPVTTDTITAAAGTPLLYVAPAGTIAALTVKLPPAPATGQSISISFGQIVSALTLLDGAAATITGAASAGAVGVATSMRYDGTKWIKWS